jgi:predicted GIY-YIG superfamily endonuclease
MATAQRLLFPDPQPLVERLGREFFRGLPESPGVYLMRDATHLILYVGKAKNLRKRLARYLTANPERLSRRRLRLLHAVATIEVHACVDEAAALRHEASLLRTLKPRFNRAGTWPAPARYLAWRARRNGLELTMAMKRSHEKGNGGSTFSIHSKPQNSKSSTFLPLERMKWNDDMLDAENDWSRLGWQMTNPLGWRAGVLRLVLVRLLWCAFHPSSGISGLPSGWISGRLPVVTVIPAPENADPTVEEASERLQALFRGKPDRFCEWIQERIGAERPLFETGVIEEDLQFLFDQFGKGLDS